MIQIGDVLLIRHKTGFTYKLIQLALAVVLLVLTAQACSGEGKKVSITPSSTPVEAPVPTVSNTQIPMNTLEPTFILIPDLDSISSLSPTSTPISVLALTISVEDVKQKLDSGQNIVLVDIRDKRRFDESHIDTAISIPLDELSSRYVEIPQDLEIIVYSACT